MSFQAMTWAIEQKAGGPRAKCVLWSIANYAGPLWFAYPKQELIAEESEQSTDSVQKYLADLIGMGLVRRIKLKRFGRRTHDFLILGPSPLFQAPLDEILPHLPSGCDVMDDAAANAGSVEPGESGAPTQESEPDAAATDGSAPETTLPPPAAHATAVERQPNNEPVRNHTPTQTLPQAPPLQVADEGTEAWKRYERFKKGYPVKIIKDVATWPWFKALNEVDQEVAAAAGPRYRKECEKLNRRPMDAYKFVRDRVFDGFREDDPTPIPRHSSAGRALLILHEIAGKAHLLDGLLRATNGGIWYRKPMTPRLLALWQAPEQSRWCILSREQAKAWDDFLDEYLTIDNFTRLKEGSKAPFPWPPSKDGKLYSATDPPPAKELMTTTDQQFIDERGLG